LTTGSHADAPNEPAPQPELPRLGLREDLNGVIDTDDALVRACTEISLGHGPIALDAERASGYRYSQRAYLIQVRRAGARSYLIDPIPFGNLAVLQEAFGGGEWILHAATQDLPCLGEVGLHPQALFDTELAGRLLNLPRVGLAALVEHYLQMSLAKEFSAADWSTRPLPEPWLEYAALDVEVLIELRELVIADLERTGKLEWAHEEFDALLSFTGPPERIDPWRRTSGMHKVRSRRGLAVVRELWQARNAIAQDRDTTSGRIMHDSLIVTLALNPPTTMGELKSSTAMRARGPRRFITEWFDAIESALAIPDDELPPTSLKGDGPPPPRSWADRDPVAADRLARVKDAITQIAHEHDVPLENVLSPALVRQVAWQPPADIAEALAAAGARPWQIGLTRDALHTILAE
jgi:ribonuclease D